MESTATGATHVSGSDVNMKTHFTLAFRLLSFWSLHDWRKSNEDILTGALYDYAIRLQVKAGKALTDEITKRQLAGVPAPDLLQGVSE